MRNVLVTGSNGFIGGKLVTKLSDEYTVVGTSVQNQANNSVTSYYKWDIGSENEPNELKRLDIDYIVHTAALIDYDNLSRNLIDVNCVGSFNVMKSAVEHKAKCVVYFSSLPTIGEKHSAPIDESAKLNPSSLYHATKAAGEMIMEQANHYGVRVVSLRIPSPIGAGMSLKTIVPIFVNKALNNEDIVIQGKGTRVQNYIDVRDIAEAISKILKLSNINGIFNIGSVNAISNIALAQKCIEVLNSKSMIIYSGKEDLSDNVDWTTDDTKLKNMIGEYQLHSIENTIIDIASDIKAR